MVQERQWIFFEEYVNKREHPHTKIKGRVRVELVEAKEKYNYGPKKMSVHLEKKFGVTVSSTSVYKFMKKRRLIRKPQKKQSWYTPLKNPYYATNPGENVQLDVKYVPSGDGYWNYQFRFVDTVTNMQYSATLPMKDCASTMQAFARAKRFFPFPIVGIQTDNGGEFRGLFHTSLVQQGLTHRFIPKRSAPWNGKVERANRSVDDEFYLNVNRPWKTVSQYTHWYNHERPHLGKNMNGLTPYEKFISLTSMNCHP